MPDNRPATQAEKSPLHDPLFSEASAWNKIGSGWRPLFGNYRELGFSFEWHDFACDHELNWARSFHPGSVELCLNLEGCAVLQDQQRKIELPPRAFVFYYQGNPPLSASRRANERHRFVTVEFSPSFLEHHFAGQADNLLPFVQSVVRRNAPASQVTRPETISTFLLQLVESLRHCPVFKPAQEVWFRSKALELAAQLLFLPPAGELLCTRAQRTARERVGQAQGILRGTIENPPSLEDLGRQVGCSPYYLSRQFSQVAGLTITQYIRQIRLERAAELLRTGRCNVTEAALEVGYNSLSHFTTAFRDAFGCCPGLYPADRSASHKAQPPLR